MEAAGPERPDLSPNLSPYSAADKICRYNNFFHLDIIFPIPYNQNWSEDCNTRYKYNIVKRKVAN